MTTLEELQDFCVEEIRRLSALSYYPSDAFGRGELAKALVKHADSIDHARRIVDAIIATCRQCPPPADIAVVAGEVPATTAKQAPPKRACPLCNGSGFRTREYTIERGVFAGEKRTEAVRCGCPPSAEPATVPKLDTRDPELAASVASAAARRRMQ